MMMSMTDHAESELGLLRQDHASLLVMFNERADTITSLQAEIERLRPALQEIIKEVGTSTKAAKIAREALRSDEKER